MAETSYPPPENQHRHVDFQGVSAAPGLSARLRCARRALSPRRPSPGGPAPGSRPGRARRRRTRRGWRDRRHGAALQSARLGARTIVAEPTPWLGGMLSAAGVSATDGNHRLPSGIWREFRERIYDPYGGPEAVGTGWVSNTHFEPHVADRIFKEMAAAERFLRVLLRHRFVDVLKERGRVRGAVLRTSRRAGGSRCGRRWWWTGPISATFSPGRGPPSISASRPTRFPARTPASPPRATSSRT